MNKKSIVANIIWSLISLGINTATTMLILPYVSREIGIEAYGYIALCNNIISCVDLIASTINVYAVRFISLAYHSGDLKKANKYYNSVLAANVVIAIALLPPATICIAYINKILDVPAALTVDVRLLFVFSLVNYVITILGTVFTTASFVKNILYKDTRIRAEAYIIRGVLLLLFFAVAYPHVWYVTLVSIVDALYILTRNIVLTHSYTPEFKIDKKTISFQAVKEVATNGIWNTVASLGTTLNSGLDLIVTNFYLSATSMGQLSVPKTLSSFTTTLLTAVSNSFRPQLLIFYSQNEKQKLTDGFILAMKFCGIVSCGIFSVFAAFGVCFLNLWIPEQNVILIYRLAILTFFAETFTGFVKPLHYGCVLTGKLKVPCLCNLAVGLFNVISMIVFLNLTDLGLYVVALTTVVGNITYNFVIMPIYVTKILNIPRKKFYLMILRYFATVTVITCLLYFSFSLVEVTSWLTLFLFIVLGSSICLIIYVVMMLDRTEKREAVSMVRKKLLRR